MFLSMLKAMHQVLLAIGKSANQFLMQYHPHQKALPSLRHRCRGQQTVNSLQHNLVLLQDLLMVRGVV